MTRHPDEHWPPDATRKAMEESTARAEAAYRERYGPQEGPKRDAEATGGETGTRVTPVGFEGVSGDSGTALSGDPT